MECHFARGSNCPVVAPHLIAALGSPFWLALAIGTDVVAVVGGRLAFGVLVFTSFPLGFHGRKTIGGGIETEKRFQDILRLWADENASVMAVVGRLVT